MEPRQFRLDIEEELIVDGFAGMGGASEAIEWALGRHADAAMNHDDDALSAHRINHPQTEHYHSDIREVCPRLIARGFYRSSGNRVLQPEELLGLPQDQVFKLYRDYSLSNVYDFEHNIRIANDVDKTGWLPSTFMLLQPQSWHDEVWTDITRMLTLNSRQAAKGKEMHLCPLQFDIVDRLIEQHTMPGEEVFDPFAGLGTVPYRAIKLRRRGRGCELASGYWLDSVAYCEAQVREMSMPDLFGSMEDAA